MNKIIKKNSKGYGYEYASLADLVEQGCVMPKTKIELEDGKQFLWFYDEQLKEWLRGAEIVIPEMKANKAQQYGAALTYAFRYVTQMFNRVATGDDALIEDVDDKGERKTTQTSGKAPRKKKEEVITPELAEQMEVVDELRKSMYAQLATPEQKNNIQILYTKAEIMKMLGRMNKSMDQLTQEEALTMISARSTK